MKQGALAGFMSGFYRFGDYFILLLYVNFLWICFTLLGGIIFGWAPATAAMFAVIRQKILENDCSVFLKFWETYRQEFMRMNGLNVIVLVSATMLYSNVLFFQVESAAIFVSVRYLMIAIMIALSIMLLHIFPLVVHYEAGLFRQIKNALLITVYKPIRTVLTVGACLLVVQFLFAFPVLIPFLGPSLFALVIMWITHYTFLKIEQQHEELQVKDT